MIFNCGIEHGFGEFNGALTIIIIQNLAILLVDIVIIYLNFDMVWYYFMEFLMVVQHKEVC